MKIELKGTIVSPDYDDDFFAAWIDKGIITPSSRFVAYVESSSEPIELYVNSYGGDVFAGGEMMIALLKAQAAGRLASVEVGSIAASMAANIVAALKANGAKVAVNTNSQIMFHGCYTSTDGGAQHHEDVAESLRNINESVIANLNRIGVTECRAWFSEGREKWIGSDEAVKIGLADTMSDYVAEDPHKCKQIAARLAALASTINSRKEYSMEIDEQIPVKAEAETVAEEPNTEAVEPAKTDAVEPVEAVEPQAPEAAQEAAQPTPEDIEAKVAALANERFAGLQAKHEKMISDLKANIEDQAKSLAAAIAERDQLKADLEKANESLADTRDQLARAEQNREAVVTAALAPSAEPFKGNAREHLAALPLAERRAFYEAHRKEIDG